MPSKDNEKIFRELNTAKFSQYKNELKSQSFSFIHVNHGLFLYVHLQAQNSARSESFCVILDDSLADNNVQGLLTAI